MRKTGKRGLRTLAPQPQAVCGVFPFGYTSSVHGVVFEQLVAALHHRKICCAVFALGQVDSYLFIGDVVRGRKVVPRCAVLYHKAVAVRYPRVKGEPVAVQLFFEVLYQFARLFGGDLPRRIVGHRQLLEAASARKRNKVGAQRHIGFIKGYSHGNRFEGRTPGVVFCRVEAEHRHVGHVAPGLEPFRHCAEPAQLRFGRKCVHHGSAGAFKAGLAAEGGYLPIGHSVAEYHCIFHISSVSRCR